MTIGSCQTRWVLMLALAVMILGFPVPGRTEANSDSLRTQSTGQAPDDRVPDGFFLNDPLVIEEAPSSEMAERLFPLWKSVAKGHALPKPWSVGLYQYAGITEYTLQEATIGVGEFPDEEIDIEGTAVDIRVGVPGLRGALWLLPFLNITGTLAYSRIQTSIYMEDVPIGVTPPDPPSQPGPEINYGNFLLELDLKGPSAGAGLTFAYGYQRIWSTITFTYAYSWLEAVGWEAFGKQSFRTYLFLPKLGYSFEGTSIWIGARYMDEETRHTGSLEDGAFRFDVLIKQARWSPEVGLNTIMGENWELTVQGGYQPRIFAYVAVGYRL